MGPIGTGKSSFLNSIKSMLEKAIRQPVTTLQSNKAVTKKVLYFAIKYSVLNTNKYLKTLTINNIFSNLA